MGVGAQLNSTVSGYVATSNGSVLNNEATSKPKAEGMAANATSAKSKVGGLSHEPSTQLSYPLQKLLSQPVSYDVDDDDADLLDQHFGAHFHHHGNMYHPQYGYQRHRGMTPANNVPMMSNSHSRVQGFHRVPHGRLDHMQVPNLTGFNPAGLGRSARTSPGLPNVTVPPPLGTITVDIDV